MLNNMILTRIVATPFIVALGLIAFRVWGENEPELRIWFIPPLLALAVIYVFQHQINLWWWKKNPPMLEKPVWAMLYTSLPILQNLSPEEKDLFSSRLSIYMKTCDFIGQGVKDIPDDVLASILAPGVYFSLEYGPEFYEEYQRIVLYPHPFLSPEHPDTIHTVEINTEDGVLIFSLEQLLPGLLNSKNTLHLPLYAYASLLSSPSGQMHPERLDRYRRIVGFKDLSESGVLYHDQLIHGPIEQKTV